MDEVLWEWGGVAFAIAFMGAIPVCALLDWLHYRLHGKPKRWIIKGRSTRKHNNRKEKRV